MQFVLLASIVEGTPSEKVGPLLKPESLRAWELYAAGTFRWLLSRGDTRGVVAMIEAKDLAEAQSAVDSLPLVKEGMLHTQIIPCTPYTGFDRLFAK
jgi:hypothetical protein